MKSYLFLLELVREEDIDTLEYLYRGVQERYEQHAENTPGDLEKYLRYYPARLKSAQQLAAQWLERYPQSYAAHIILAHAVLADAYARRGALPVQHASVYSLKSLKAGMDHAAALLEAAVALSTRPFHAWLYLGHMYAVDARYGDEKEFLPEDIGVVYQLPLWYKRAEQLEPGAVSSRIAMLDALRRGHPATWDDSMQAYAYLLYNGLSAPARNEVRAAFRGHYAQYCWQHRLHPATAAQHFHIMHRLSPSMGAPALARFYWRTGEPGKAKQYFTEALTLHPEDAALLYDYADCLAAADPAAPQAVIYFRRAARYGYPAAWQRLGDIYRQGLHGQEKHIRKAVSYYHIAWREGCLEAGERLVHIFWKGHADTGAFRNRDKAVRLLKVLAQDGSGWACARLAELELEARTRDHDYSMATYYINLGIHYGSMHCYYLVGKRIYEGRLLWRGVHIVPGNFFKPNRADRKMAIDYLQKSAALGYVKAMACLARYFDRGYEEDRSPAAAADWYCKTADLDPQDRESCCYAAFRAVFYGEHKGRNLKAAARYLHQGAAVNGSECQYRLAYELLNGGFAYDRSGVLQPHLGPADARNVRMALQLYEKAADAGHVEAMYYLAAFYERHAASKADHLKAFLYFLLAAEAGKTIAQKEVGCYYLNGLAVEKNETHALFWLNMAADSGEPAARELLEKVGRQQ